jgi:hypothetical protein
MNTPSCSQLLPDVDAETYAQAQAIAASLSTGDMSCDADDVLLAGYLMNFGQHVMQAPDNATQVMRKLFGESSHVGQRSLVGLARSIRKMHSGELPIEQACLDFVTTLSAVLVVVAPDRKPLGKHGRG